VRAPKVGSATGTAKAPTRNRASRVSGTPIPPSFRGVLVRAVIVAALFYPYLIYIAKEKPAPALTVTVIAFAIMIPLGMLLDRWRFRFQTRRFEQKRAERHARRPSR
jgi:hypothetical protein